MDVRPICQPIDVDPKLAVTVENVVDPADSRVFGRFAHYHDACELIWFRHVRGTFYSEAGVFDLRDGAGVFVPSMRYHDFAYEHAHKEWVLIHIDPALVQSLVKARGLRALETPVCVNFDDVTARAVDAMCAWISHRESWSSDPFVAGRVTEMFLTAIARAQPNSVVETGHSLDNLARIRPALDLISDDPSAPLSMADAASRCSLSAAYFSRRFKDLIGMNFSEYVLLYRLRLAARELIATGHRIGDIAHGLGFATPAHFANSFRNHFGVSPRAYRQHARGDVSQAAAVLP